MYIQADEWVQREVDRSKIDTVRASERRDGQTDKEKDKRKLNRQTD